MNKEFVPYEQALALKELGFDEHCLGWYAGKDREVYYNQDADELIPFVKVPITISKDSKTRFLAPLYQQAFRWFREKYGLYCNFVSEFYSDGINFNWQVMWYIPKEEWTEFHVANGTYWYGDNNEFPTQEEAELACLNKLIEICKEKKS